jgi:hypothetical protein
MIIFQNRRYKTRELELPEFGDVLISTDTLNDNLLGENGSYASEQALNIDEQVFYFVEEHEIELPDTKLKRLLINQIK